MRVIPDEVIRYALGRFGRPNIPIDGAVMDRIMSLPRTKEIQAEPPMASVAELRRKLGAQLTRRGTAAARHHAREPGGCHAGRRARAA